MTIPTDDIKNMTSDQLAACCDHYDLIMAGLDPDEDAERMRELSTLIRDMESELELRIERGHMTMDDALGQGRC